MSDIHTEAAMSVFAESLPAEVQEPKTLINCLRHFLHTYTS